MGKMLVVLAVVATMGTWWWRSGRSASPTTTAPVQRGSATGTGPDPRWAGFFDGLVKDWEKQKTTPKMNGGQK